MLEPEIISFFSGTLVSFIGTRDAKLQAHTVMAWGVKLDADKKQITAFIPKEVAARTLSNLENNQRIAFSASEPLQHETYQFKGTFTVQSESDASVEQIAATYVQRFYDNYLKLYGYPPEILQTFNYKPLIGISFDIEEIYVQTPGPKAGNIIYKQPIAI